MPSFFSFAALLIFAVFPFVVAADGFPPDSLVPGCFTETDYQVRQCDFEDLVHLIRHLIDFAFFLAMPVATALFTYAGFLYLFEAAKPGSRGKANAIFTSVLIGFFWMLAAWFVVKLITGALLRPEYG